MHLHGQRQDLGVQRGAGIADALPAGQGGSFGLNGLLGALDGSQHRGHLGQVALGFLQISGHGICIVLGVIFCQNLFAGSKQCIINRQRHFRQAAGVHFQLVQLALGGVQLGFQPRNLLFQLGDLLVQLVDGIPQLLGQALLLGIQLGFAGIQLALGTVQLRQAVLDFGLVFVQLLFGFGQAVAHLDQQFVIHLVNFVLVQRDLH